MKKSIWVLGIGFVAGMAVMAVLVVLLMPGMMIVQEESRLGFDETVSALEQAIEDQGWVHSQTINLNKSVAKEGANLEPKVRLVKLCKPEYAVDVLTTDRQLSALMPCTVAVWEDDEGKVMISKMNTGLMGKLFGGNVARVMGGFVADDEKAMIAEVL